MIFTIAFRNILRHRRRSFLTGLTLTVGYVLLSLAFSVMEGSYSNLINRFTLERTGHVQVHRKGYLDRPDISHTIRDPSAVVAILEADPEVIAFTPRILGPALAYAHDKSVPVQVSGIDLRTETTVTNLAEKIDGGSLSAIETDESGVFDVMIGAVIAKNLRLKLSDDVILISQGADGSIANDRYRVAAIIGSEDGSDRLTVYMPIRAAREFFVMPGQVHEFVLRLKRFQQAPRVAANLNHRFGKNGVLEAQTWQRVEEDFYRAMQTDRAGNIVTYSIVIFMVAIGVLNVVLMSILERTREFGVLKAIGTKPNTILGMIVLETVLLSLMSIAVGFVIAIPVNYWFEVHGIVMDPPFDIGGISYDRISGELSIATLLEPAFVIVGVAIAVSLFPGLRAAHVRVVDALRSA